MNVCEVLVIPEEETHFLDGTVLFNYYFCWGDNQKDGAVALGLGSIYNHSYTPNAVYRVDLDDQVWNLLLSEIYLPMRRSLSITMEHRKIARHYGMKN